jgi:hypothetical protein
MFDRLFSCCVFGIKFFDCGVDLRLVAQPCQCTQISGSLAVDLALRMNVNRITVAGAVENNALLPNVE